jgi:DNA polymerase-3 subunit gamma/tau
MAYEVTATRRRPKTFDELAGQEFVVTTLKSSIESGRIAHAYLFSGPRGCGKTSAARIMARSLNCEKGPSAIPCGVCSNCQEISRGSSLDVIEIDGASNTSVNDVRQIKDEVLFPPNAGRYKIYIIDEVHMLSNSAFNALLKTIEEPPPYIVFIFATTELHKVPATIKSRCQQFAFRLIPIERIAEILAETCKEMNIQAEDEALFWIAKESTGSLRDAYTLFDQVASFSDGHLRSELIREKLGLVGLDKLNALAEACAENNTKNAFAIIDELLSSGVAIEQFVIDLSGYYRSLLLLKNGVTRDSLLGYSPDRFSSLVLEKTSSVQIERGLSLLLDLYRDIRYSVSPRFELETTVSKLAWINQWLSPTELKSALDDVRQFVPQGFGANSSSTQKKNDSERNGEINRPLAEAGEYQNRPIPNNFDDGDDSFLPDDDSQDASDALTEGFKRLMSSKEGTISTEKKADKVISEPETANQSDESESLHPLPEPVWDNYRNEGNTVYKTRSSENFDADDNEVENNAADESNHDNNSQDIPIVISEVKEKLIALFKKERAIFASGLEKSLDWEWDGNKLIIPVPDFLVAELLQKEINSVKDQFVSMLQKSAIIEIIVKNDGNNSSDKIDAKIASPQVELVRQFFRGTIVKAK